MLVFVPQILPETKLKSCGLMALVEKISSQPNIDYVFGYLYTLSYRSAMKKNKWDNNKYKTYSLRRKRAPGNLMLEPRFVLKEEEIKERPD